MIAASGLMLIYATWHPEARLPILLYSIAGKLGFIALVLAEPSVSAREHPGHGGRRSVIVALLGWYLLARGEHGAGETDR